MDIIDELQAEFVGLDHQTDNYFRVSSGKLKYKEGSVVNLIPHF